MNVACKQRWSEDREGVFDGKLDGEMKDTESCLGRLKWEQRESKRRKEWAADADMAAAVAAELRSEGVLTAQPVFNVHINYHNVSRVLALSQSV